MVSDLHASLGGVGQGARWTFPLGFAKGFKDFWRQQLYGAFTVGAPEIEKVREYINHQAEHHRTKTFQEEYVSMLKRGMVEYKEEYLW